MGCVPIYSIYSEEWQSIKSHGDFNQSQIATGSQKHRDPRFLPWVFTEHGAISDQEGNKIENYRGSNINNFKTLDSRFCENDDFLWKCQFLDKLCVPY